MRFARPWSVRSRDPPPGPKAGRWLSWGFAPLRHVPTRRIRFFPGIPAPGTFRPQGLVTLPAASSPPCLTTARRPPQRPWGSPFRALLLPASGTPLGASPLLSFSSPPEGEWPRLQRLALTGKGPDSPPPEGRDGRTLPSWDSAPPRLPPPPPSDRLPGPVPSCSSAGDSPYVPRPDRAPGDLQWRKRPGLSRDCRPSWGLAPHRIGGSLRATCAPGLWLRLGPRTLASEGLLGTPDCPTGV
jgi:hypothetical protein